MRPVLAVSGADLWCMSTPNGKRGFFWEAWTKGGRGVDAGFGSDDGVRADSGDVFEKGPDGRAAGIR